MSIAENRYALLTNATSGTGVELSKLLAQDGNYFILGSMIMENLDRKLNGYANNFSNPSI